MAIMRHKYGYKTSSREQIMYFLCTYLKYFFFLFCITNAEVYVHRHLSFANIRISRHFSSPPDFSLVVIKAN